MSRTKNAVRNIYWGFAQKAITLLLPFVARTVLIKVLGGEYLGLSGLFTSLLSILSLVELGVSNAIISSMYKAVAENDEKTICALMLFFKKAYRVIGIIILIVGVVIIPFLPHFIKGDVPADINVYYLYIIYLFNTVVSYFLFAYKNCLFAAYQRNDVNSRVQLICLIAQNVVQIILLILFKNYYIYAVIIPIFTITTNVAIAFLAKKAYPQFSCKGTLTKETKSDLNEKVVGLMVAKISVTIRSSIDSLFVSLFLGLMQVAIYSNYFYIATAVSGLILIIEPALVAGVGNSLVTESKEKNYNDMLKFTFILQWIVSFCSICVLCLTQSFMNLWVGLEYMLNDTMALLCAIYVFVVGICLIRSIYTQALGLWWKFKLLSFIDVFVNVILNYFLGKYFGAYGILAATIVDIAFVSIPWATYIFFKNSFGKQYFKNYIWLYVKYFIVAAFVGGIVYLICQKVCFDTELLNLCIRAVICLVVPNVAFFIIYRKNKYFREMLLLAKGMLKKLKFV